MKDLKVPDARRTELIENMRKNDAHVVHSIVRGYLKYLDGQSSLASRLCDSGVPAWVAFGDKGYVGLADHERAALEQCPSVTLLEVSPAGHMTLNEQPAQVANIVLLALADMRT